MKQNLKVIHLTHYSHSLVSENYEDDIYDRDWNVRSAKQLKKYYPEIEVEVWNIERKYKKEVSKNINNILFRTFTSTIPIRFGKEISLPFLRAIKKEIKDSKKQNKKLILHLHGLHYWHGIIIPRLFKDNIIFAQHHAGRAPLEHIKRKKIYKLLFPFLLIEQLFENRSIKNWKKIYYLTEDEKKYLLKKGLNDKIEFRTMGVDFDKFKPKNKQTARRNLKLNKKDFVMIFVGSVIERKGLYYLTKAMRKISKEIPNSKLLIIGETEKEISYYKKLQQEIKKLNLSNIEFLGRVPNEKIITYLSASDLYVQPALHEGAPVSVMEALASNLPVIATDVGSTNKMIKSNTGLIINPASSKEIEEAVIKFQKNKSKFKNPREKSREFDWENIINKTVIDYKNAK